MYDDAEARRIFGDELDGLVEDGYFETRIHPDTKEQMYRWTPFGLYETATHLAFTENPGLVEQYENGEKGALGELVEAGVESNLDPDPDALYRWMQDSLEDEGERLEDPEAFIEEAKDGR